MRKETEIVSRRFYKYLRRAIKIDEHQIYFVFCLNERTEKQFSVSLHQGAELRMVTGCQRAKKETYNIYVAWDFVFDEAAVHPLKSTIEPYRTNCRPMREPST